jgi:hypothetical protein
MSTKLAMSVKFDSIGKDSLALLVRTLNGRFVPPVQFVNLKPVAAVAVME